MTKSKYIFEQLARPGERWDTTYVCEQDNNNPDFSTWSGFGWAWERAQEKGTTVHMTAYGDAIYITLSDLNGRTMNWIFPQEKVKQLPTRLFNALYEFLKGGRT